MEIRMEPMQSIAEEFSATLQLRVDKFQHTRKVISRLAHCKYSATNDGGLAEKIGLTSKIRNHIVNDYLMFSYFSRQLRGEPACIGKNAAVDYKIQSIPEGMMAKWLLSKTEFETLVLFYLYVENKSYEQIAEEIIILDVKDVMEMQIKHVSNICKEILG